MPLGIAMALNKDKLLDKLGVDLIELEGIKDPRIDALQIKSIVAAVNDSRIAVPVELSNDENIEKTWCALKNAKNLNFR